MNYFIGISVEKNYLTEFYESLYSRKIKMLPNVHGLRSNLLFKASRIFRHTKKIDSSPLITIQTFDNNVKKMFFYPLIGSMIRKNLLFFQQKLKILL